MSNHGLTKENLVATLPVALQKDESAVALAEAIAELLAQRPAEIDRLRIYPAIDQLDEQLLDILAYDFKVDWWDPDYTLEQKRRTLKSSWRVHKMLGTKAAVERAISAIYPDTKVLEWFEYGGEPYHFRLSIDTTYMNSDPTRHQRVLDRLNFYKNLRSHLDSIDYHATGEGEATVHVGAKFAGYRLTMYAHVPEPKGVDVPNGDAPANAGVAVIRTIQTITTKAGIPGELHPPEYRIPAHISVSVYGVHEKITTEVSVNGEI